MNAMSMSPRLMLAAPASLCPLGGSGTPQHMNRKADVKKWWDMVSVKKADKKIILKSEKMFGGWRFGSFLSIVKEMQHSGSEILAPP